MGPPGLTIVVVGAGLSTGVGVVEDSRVHVAQPGHLYGLPIDTVTAQLSGAVTVSVYNGEAVGSPGAQTEVGSMHTCRLHLKTVGTYTVEVVVGVKHGSTICGRADTLQRTHSWVSSGTISSRNRTCLGTVWPEVCFYLARDASRLIATAKEAVKVMMGNVREEWYLKRRGASLLDDQELVD